MYLLLSRATDFSNAEQRYPSPNETTTTQLLIVDAHLHDTPLRFVVTHTPPQTNMHLKLAHYAAVRKELDTLLQNDRAHGSQPRRHIWMADHNMVCDPINDEMGSSVSHGTKYYEMVDAVESIETLIEVSDAYRYMHGPVYAPTHKKRRLDRIAVHTAWLSTTLPHIAELEHIEREQLEVVAPGTRGRDSVHTPTHKAVQVTLRTTSTTRAKAEWKYTDRTYPPTVWKQVLADLDQRDRKVQLSCNTQTDGLVRVTLNLRSSADRHRDMLKRTKETLIAHEKAVLNANRRTVGKLRKKKEILTERANNTAKHTREYQGLKAQLRRTEEVMRRHKIANQLELDEVERSLAWAINKSKGTASLFQKVTPVATGSGNIIGLKPKPTIANPTPTMQTQQREIERICEEHFRHVFNMHAAIDPEPEATADSTSYLRRLVRAHMEDTNMEGRTKAMHGLKMSSILHPDNIDLAIRSVRKDTVPGSDGFDTNFYNKTTKRTANILRDLFWEIHKTQDMTEAMKMAAVSVLYKGKGRNSEDMKSYRPISITPSEYRILTRAIQQKLEPAVRAVIGKTQVGYLSDGRQARDNTILLAETAQAIEEEEGKGGIAVQVDNSAAFDRVKWEFMHAILEDFGFPQDFRELVRTMYSDIGFQVKVNGQTGQPQPQTNGVRQGCCASPLLFILVQEVLLIAIRRDPELKGIRLPNGEEIRERCLADDTVVFLESTAQLPKLFAVIDGFQIASGQELEASKSSTILLGTEAEKYGDTLSAQHAGMKWVRYGVDETDKGLGIRVGSKAQVTAQWKELLGGVNTDCASRMSALKEELCTTAKVTLVRGAYAARIPYQAGAQIPPEKEAEAIIRDTQQTLDRAVFNGFYFVTRHTARQPREEGGINQIDLRRRLQAEWASLCIDMLNRKDSWHTYWWDGLERTYGALGDKELMQSTCAFRLLRKANVSELQKQAFRAFAQLQRPHARDPPEPKT